MIKAEELMLGNWVKVLNYYHCDGSPYTGQVNGITKKHGTYYLQFGSALSVEIDMCEPIPITPEILEKNGFIKSTPPPGIHARCYELNNKKDRYNLTIADYNKYKRLLLNVDSEDSECFNIKCDYVHQLQHALKLCGITKNIEL